MADIYSLALSRMARGPGAARPDLLRQIVEAFADALMSAEADAVCGPTGWPLQSGRTGATGTSRGSGTPERGRFSGRFRGYRTGTYYRA